MIEFEFEIIILTISILTIIYITFKANSVKVYEDPKIYELKRALILIDPRVANVNFYASNKSFTEDKKRIYLCLKDRNGNYYSDSMLIYVACHELAHAFSNSIDYSHTTDEFKNNYSSLLNKARDLGLWNENEPIDHQYCS